MSDLREDMRKTLSVVQEEVEKLYAKWPNYSFSLRVEEREYMGQGSVPNVLLDAETRLP